MMDAEARGHVTVKIKREADDEDHVFVSPSFTLTTCDPGCGPKSAGDYDGGPFPVEIKPEVRDYQHVTESQHMIRSSHDDQKHMIRSIHDEQKPMSQKNSEISCVEDGRSSVAHAVKDKTHVYMHESVTQCAEHDACKNGDLGNTDQSSNAEAKAEIRYIQNANNYSNICDGPGSPEVPTESPSTDGRVETAGDPKYGVFETPGGHHDGHSTLDTNDHSNKNTLQRERSAESGQAAVYKIRNISNIDRSDGNSWEQIIEKYNDNPIMEQISLERALNAAREKETKVSSNESREHTSTSRRTKTKSAREDKSVSCNQYRCSSCELELDSQEDLKEHVRIHHRKSYRKLSLLLRNIRTKCSITDEDMFHCQQCGKAYMFASDLNRHMTFHEEEKLLHAETTEMQKRIRRRNTLKLKSDRWKQIVADRNMDHSCQSNKDHICNICWIAFPSDVAFLEHKLHPEKAIPGKRYQTGMAAACSTRQWSDGSYANRWTKPKNDANCSHNQTGSFREEQSRDGKSIAGTSPGEMHTPVISHSRGSIEDHFQSGSNGTEESEFGDNPPRLCSSNKPYLWQNQSYSETIPRKAPLPCSSTKPHLLQNHTSNNKIPWELPLCSGEKPYLFQSHASNETIPCEPPLPSSSKTLYVLKNHPSTQTKPCKPPQLCASSKPYLLQSQTSNETMPVEYPLPCSSNKPYLLQSQTSNETMPVEYPLPCSSNKPYLLQSQTSNETMPVEYPLPCSSNKPNLLQSQTSNETMPVEYPLPCSSNKPNLLQSQTSNETMPVEYPLPCTSNKPYMLPNHASNVTMSSEAPLRCSSNEPYLLQSHTTADTIQCEPALLDSRNKLYLLQSHTSSENARCPSTKPYLMQNHASKLKDNVDNAQSDREPWDPPAERPELNTEKDGKRKPASNAKKCKARYSVSVASKTNWRSYQPKLMCFDCGVTFNCQADILRHRCRRESQTDVDSSPSGKTVQRTQTGRTPNLGHSLFCRFCRSGFTYPSNLRKHLRNGSSPRYKCIECSEPFCLQKSLEDHVLSCHNDTFMCRLCETFFATGRSLSKHMARHEPEGTDTERFYPEDEGKQNEPSASPVAQTSQHRETFPMQKPPTIPPVSQASNMIVPTEPSPDNSQPDESAPAFISSAPEAPSSSEPSETSRQLCRAVSEISTDRLQPAHDHVVRLPSFASPTQPVRLLYSFRRGENYPSSSTRSDTECSPLDEPTQPLRQTETRTNGADNGHQESAADRKDYGLQENNIPRTQRAQEVDTFGNVTFDLHDLHFQGKGDTVSMDLSDEKGELLNDEDTAAADKAYVCIECDSWFAHKAQLEAHLLDADGFNIPLSCYVCKQSFLCLDALKKHVQLHETDVKRKDHWKKPEGPSSCGVPSSSQTRNSGLSDCIFTEKNEIENDVGEVLENTPGSPPERHSVHQRGEIFDSAKTQASCEWKHTSKRREMLPQRTSSFPAETETLPEGAPRKKYKPEPRKRRHRCALCPAAFQRASLLETHVMVHTGERPYQCPDCGSSFSENGGLKRHSRVHTRERPYACEACGKDFTDASSVRRHLKSPAHKWTIRQLQWALDSAAEMERCYGARQDE